MSTSPSVSPSPNGEGEDELKKGETSVSPFFKNYIPFPSQGKGTKGIGYIIRWGSPENSLIFWGDGEDRVDSI
jgi:hypothetical protein